MRSTSRTRIGWLVPVFVLAAVMAAPALTALQTAAPAAPQTRTDTVDPALLGGAEFRHLSVFSRGGRVTAVAGVPGNQQLYYMGSTGGGVWRTTDAGANWKNISDGFFEAGSIG